jgi:F420-dependent oxidoreductase-like protein
MAVARKAKRLTFKTKPEHTTWDDLLAMWLEAETIEELDGGWLYDHFYPIYGDQEGPCFEGWTALSYLAGRTRRLRLGLLVTGNPYRNPAVLANMAATFDIFSGGRLDFGIGAGWNVTEANAYGMPLLPIGQRLDQLEEACRVIKSLFTNETTTFEGKHYRMTEARCEPKPVQKPHPPFTLGGMGEKRMLKIAAMFADDWNYPGGPPEDLARKVEILHKHCATVGRDPAEITTSCHLFVSDSPQETAERAAAYVEAGAEHVVLYFTDNSNVAALRATVKAVSAATM